METIRIYIGDELRPAINGGYRTVMARVGHKWVYVKEHCQRDNPKKQFKRISRTLWDKLRGHVT